MATFVFSISESAVLGLREEPVLKKGVGEKSSECDAKRKYGWLQTDRDVPHSRRGGPHARRGTALIYFWIFLLLLSFTLYSLNPIVLLGCFCPHHHIHLLFGSIHERFYKASFNTFLCLVLACFIPMSLINVHYFRANALGCSVCVKSIIDLPPT